MDSRLNKKLAYPEYTTYVSHRLVDEPVAGDRPEEGAIYQWESVEGDVVYVNIRFHEGEDQAYMLRNEQDPGIDGPEQSNSNDFEFEYADVDQETKTLTVDNTFCISGVLFYRDSTKTECDSVSLPMTVGDNSTVIHFDDVNPSDYQYGGKVRFSHGIVRLYSEDSVHHLSSASGQQELNASLGYTLVMANVTGDLYLSKQNVINLPLDKMLKVVVDMTGTNHNAYVEGNAVAYDKFFVCYMNLNGTIVHMGRAVEID